PLRAEQALTDVPPAFGELRGAERDVHAAGITEQDVVIAIAIAVIGGAALASSRGGGLHGMRLEDPVADVDYMNILLDDDVTGEHTVVHPIPQPALGGCGVRPSWASDVTG